MNLSLDLIQVGCNCPGDEISITTGRCGVDGQGTLGTETQQIVRPASLETGAREAATTKRLDAHDGTNGAAIDINIADPAALFQFGGAAVDPALQTQREPVSQRVDLVWQFVPLRGTKTRQLEHRSENFLADML